MTPSTLYRECVALDGARATAIFSADERHRFNLRREFVGYRIGNGWPLFIMLNPSRATHEVSDPTVTRCAGFARRLGYLAFEVANLFSLRSTDPQALRNDLSAAGQPLNDFAIMDAATQANIVVCAWGVHGKLRARNSAVCGILMRVHAKLRCLGTTKDGHPRHPLYLANDTALQSFEMDFR